MMDEGQSNQLFPSLAEADSSIADALSPGGWVATLQQHAAQVRAGDPNADQMLSHVLACFGRNSHYLGAPVRVGGRVVGALCAWYETEEAMQVAARRALLEQQATVVAKVLEAI